MSRFSQFPEYIPVAVRRAKAAEKIAKMKKKGEIVHPVVIEGRTIARTFWGKSWCENLESYSDYENRLPRGRTYVRNGSVIDLQLSEGCIAALVSGSSIYKVKIEIDKVCAQKWEALTSECAGKIDSVIELLQGKISKGVMEIITGQGNGLFPTPQEIHLGCSCPDYATMCKHVAAVLYGVGARLDASPQDLFSLRQINYDDLIRKVQESTLTQVSQSQENSEFSDDLSDLFGINFAPDKNVA